MANNGKSLWFVLYPGYYKTVCQNGRPLNLPLNTWLNLLLIVMYFGFDFFRVLQMIRKSNDLFHDVSF